MAVPNVYANLQIPWPLLKFSQFACIIGITRWIPALSENDALKYGTLTEEEKELYKLLIHRRSSTKNMLNEVKFAKENEQTVSQGTIPTVPMLLFVSNGEGTGFSRETWQNFQKQFTKKQGNSQYIELHCSHNLHNIEYKRIAEEVKHFIERL